MYLKTFELKVNEIILTAIVFNAKMDQKSLRKIF